MTDSANESEISRLLRSPRTIRARLNYNPPALPVLPNVTIRSNHAFLTDKYNPVPLSPRSYTRAILNEPLAASAAPSAGNAQCSNAIDIEEDRDVVLSNDATTLSAPTVEISVGNVDELKTAFVQRKEEREKCSKEFADFLSSSLATHALTKVVPIEQSEAIVDHNSTVEPINPSQTITDTIKPSQCHPDTQNSVKSKTAILKLSPHNKDPAKMTARNARFRPTKPTNIQRKSTSTEVPLLKIGCSPKASSINMDTDRQPPLITADPDGSSATARQRSASDTAQARKFMAEQQKKRKQASKTIGVQEKNAAEERKRRLAELQMHTRKIVQRNVNKNITKVSTVAQHKNNAETVSNRNTARDDSEPTKRPFIDTKPKMRRGPDRGTIHFAFAPPQTETDRSAHVISEPATVNNAAATAAVIVADATNEAMYSPDTAPTTSQSASNRRAGILRRPDEPDEPNSQRIASPMNIHFDQLLAPRLEGMHPLSSASALTDSPRQTTSSQLLDYSKVHAHALEMPDVKLHTTTAVAGVRSKNAVASKNTPLFSVESAPPTHHERTASGGVDTVNVPHWLRPSPTQVYPYNFIMAVRKKLELIANPTQSAVHTKTENAAETPRARPSYFKKKNTPASGFRKKLQRPEMKDPSNVLNQDSIANFAAEPTPKRTEIMSESDALTNLSSMSLQVPPSSSHNKNKARKNNANKQHQTSDSDSQATLSISSAIFSQSSPEKKKPIIAAAVEPLSTEAITDLRVNSSVTKTRSKSTSIAYPFVNTRRGSDMPSKTQDTRIRSTSSTTQLDKSNIINMLDSFNRSLSHAISVNQKLHETLNRPAIETPRSTEPPKISSASNREEYSSKFDSISSQATLSQPNTAKSASSPSTSLLENESSIESSVIVPADSARSFQTDSIKTAFSTVASDTAASKTSTSSATATSSGQSTLIETNQTSITQTSLASATTERKSVSSIPTQIGTAEELVSNATVSSVVRHFEENYNAPLSERSLDAPNWQVADAQSPISVNRNELSAKDSVQSLTTSTTVTIRSLNGEDMVAIDDANKENLSTNAIRTNYKMRNKGEEIELVEEDDKYRRASDRELNKSIGSDIFVVFNQTDIEYSLQHTAHSTSTTTLVSEANISYSTLGMYDQLLKSEDQKSLDLTALVKARERALMDRTKGQIAWLELQKQKYQERGLTAQISAVKKKQRALLMRLEKERADLARSAKPDTVCSMRPKHSAVLRLSQLKIPTVRRSASPLVQPSKSSATQIKTAVRAIDFTGGQNLEAMLQQREKALQQRRAHVESLIRWHQRLDEEEQIVAEMEGQLMARTNRMHSKHLSVGQSVVRDSVHPNRSPQRNVHQRQIKTIEHSLEILNALPSNVSQQRSDTDAEATENTTAEMNEERVSVSGSKLNRLWRRLTGESACKFIPDRKYELSKADIASVYEEAKGYVLAQFEKHSGTADDPLSVLDQTKLSTTSTITGGGGSAASAAQRSVDVVAAKIAGATTTHHSIACDEFIVVPALNLNFTSAEEHSLSASDADGGRDAGQSGYYFADDVQSLCTKDDHQAVHPADWDCGTLDDGHGSTRSLDASSPKTFQIQPPIGNRLRDSAFSVDSLNSSRPEVSEATSQTSGGADDSNSTPVVVTAKIDDSKSSMASTTSEGTVQPTNPPDLNETPQIADISCPTLMNDSISMSEQSMATSSSVHTQLTAPSLVVSPTTFNTADNQGSATTSATSSDNIQHLRSSYSERFDSTITTSDKISEEIKTTAEMSSELVSEDLTKISTIDSRRAVDDKRSSEEISEVSIATSSSPASSSQTIPTTMKSSSNDASDDKENQQPSVNSVTEQNDVLKRFGGPTSRGNDDSAVLHVTLSENSSTTYEMPDIISEAEVLRRQQMRIEEEIKQLEESATAPFVYIREIPNKPPPPYVPPAHGSPMTAIFPSDSRIQEIVYRRVQQLLKRITNGRSGSGDNSSSIELDDSDLCTADSSDNENITNIYERIALDICAECLKEFPVNAAKNMHFRHPLAFYNPPDRLQCMQQHVLQRVKKLLRHPHATTPTTSTGVPGNVSSIAIADGCNASAGAIPVSTLVTAVQTTTAATDEQQIAAASPASEASNPSAVTAVTPLPTNFVKHLGGTLNNPQPPSHQQSSRDSSNDFCSIGAKRKLWWNEILLNEMMEDDSTWTNFDVERTEVLRTVSDEIVRMLVEEALVDCESAFDRKAATAVALK